MVFTKTEMNVGTLLGSDFIWFLPVLPLVPFLLFQDPTQYATLLSVGVFLSVYIEKHLEGCRQKY